MPLLSSIGAKGLGFSTPLPIWSDTTLATPTYNVSYSDGVSATTADNSSITYSLASGSLPSGFSLNSSTGAVTGTYTTPVNVSTSPFSFTIRAKNASGYIEQAFSWNITIPFTTSGGTSYSAGSGYTGVYFTANGTFSVLTGSKTVEVFIVGGGGGGGGGAVSYYPPYGLYVYGAGGGGAGGFYNYTSPNLVGGYSTSVTIGGAGAGGAGNISYGSGIFGNTGFSGSSSTAVSLAGSGGNGGGGGYAYAFSYGQGGSGGNSSGGYSGGSGGVTYNLSSGVGGGGGGAGPFSSGSNGSDGTGGAGGSGYTLLNATVSNGGGGGATSAGGTSSNHGAGGGGASYNNTGSTGVGGVVYFRWLT